MMAIYFEFFLNSIITYDNIFNQFINFIPYIKNYKYIKQTDLNKKICLLRIFIKILLVKHWFFT